MSELLLTQKPWMVLLDLVLLFLLYLVFKPASKRVILPNSRRNRGYFLILLFCLFSLWGTDWFHYYRLFIELKNDSLRITNIEEVYVWIITNIAFNYLTFRLIIWGTALLFFYDSLKKLSIDKDIASFLFVSTSLIWFAYARVSLPMSMLFWGTSIIYNKEKRYSLIWNTIGIATIFSTFYFHKTSFFGMFVLLLAVVMNKLDRKFYIILLFLFPFLVFVVRNYLTDFLLLDISSENSDFGLYLDSAQGYMGKEYVDKGIGSILQRLLEVTPYYLMLVLCIKLKRNRDYQTIPLGIKTFINICLLIVVLSSVFLFIDDVNTSTIYIRFLRFGFIPTIIIMSYCWKYNLYYKLVHLIWQIGLSGSLYAVSYALYNSFVS